MTRPTLGFIGVGVMGFGMCKNLAQKSGCTVLAADLHMDNVHALADAGVSRMSFTRARSSMGVSSISPISIR